MLVERASRHFLEGKKVLVVLGTVAHMGGAERQALYLVKHLATIPRCRVAVLAFEDGTALRPELKRSKIDVHIHNYYFRWPLMKRIRSLVRLGLWLRCKVKPDILLPFVGIHSKAMAQVWPVSGARFCWWNQQDEGRDLHGTDEERRLLHKVSCIISNSEAGRDFLVETYGISSDSVLVYNNGTPVRDLVPSGNQPVAPRTDISETNRRLSVCMVANVTAFKDHETLLRAWVRVRNHFSSRERPVLHLAGHLRDQETVIKLKVLIFELGLSKEDVEFLGPVEDVERLVMDSAVVVHSSLTEGCPNAVCEAMALARPVVATDIPGCRQALGEEGYEWLAKPRDEIGLADKIIRLLESEETRITEGARNRRRIETHFSIDRMNQFFVDCIRANLVEA